MRRAIPLLLAAVAVAGCGNSRTGPPDVSRPSPSSGQTKLVRTPSAGVAYRAPRNWRVTNGAAPPLVSSIVSGSATVAIWRYPREESLPATQKDLEQARKDLVAAIRRRDPQVRIASSKLTRHQGHDAILVLATEQIAGRARRVRSLHVFAEKGEVVVDGYARPRDFPVIDRSVFRPIMASLRVTAPKGAKS